MDFLLSSWPSNILLLTTFLLISHFPIYGHAGREFHNIADCAFHLGDYSFNLCPLTTAATKYSRDLIDNNGDIDLVEEPSSGTKLEVAQLLPTSCDSDTWVCMTDDGHHFLAKGRPQSTEIEILCNFNVDSYLEFINERDGIHSFRWTTRHGCPTNIKRNYYIPSSKLFATTTTDLADDESDSEEEKGDEELLPQSGQSTARRWIAVISVIVVIIVLCSALLATYPRMPKLSTASIKLRPIGSLCGIRPFRQGSNQLVRWAEEDMTLREADEESWSGLEFDEFIPLAPNPKYGRSKDVKSYGTTPDVETFQVKL